MNFAFTEEQDLIRDSAREFLNGQFDSELRRNSMQEQNGYDPGIWQGMAEDMGWAALHIPEDYEGLQLGFVEQAILMEEMGNALLNSPYFATLCLAANALILAGTTQQKSRYLPAIARGELTATIAFTESNARWDADAVTAQYVSEQQGYVLNGTKRYVLDGHSADLVIVAARENGTAGQDGLSLFLLEHDHPGLKRVPLTTMDQTRKQAELVLKNVQVEKAQRLDNEGQCWPVLDKVLQLASISLAAEQLGGARRCLDMTVEYSKERMQFGRPIGSFQAVKHKCADMMLQVESAVSAVYYAACIADEGSDELKEAASIAKAYCSEIYMQCAAQALQLHGGIGFTWEYDLHLYFKRARAMENYLGSPDFHRQIVAQCIGLDIAS